MPSGLHARKNRKWVWFFVLLILLTATSVGIQIWYNQGQLLTRSKLDEALALWKARAPGDYDLRTTFRKPDSQEVYEVEVRDRKVVSVTRDGEPVEPRQYHYSSMQSLLGFVDDFLVKDEADQIAGKHRIFASVRFNPEDGHLVRYVRSVAATRERLEITVEFRKPNASQAIKPN